MTQFPPAGDGVDPLPGSAPVRMSQAAGRAPGQPARPSHRAAPWAVAILATVIAAVGSWHVSLWTDESATISAARRPIGELWRMLDTIDAVHGAYYFGMHFWIQLFGASPFALRLPSALAVGLATAGVYLLGARLAGRDTAIVGACVFIVLPRATWSGIEARPYAFTALTAVWCTVALAGAVDEPGRKSRWFGYAALLAAGVYLNLYLALLAPAHLLTVLLGRYSYRQVVGRWFIAAVGSALVSLPLVLRASGQTGQLGGDSLHWANLIRSVGVNQWFLGDTPTTTTGRRVGAVTLADIGSWWQPASILLAVCCWLVIAFAAAAGARSWRAAAPTATAGWRAELWMIPWIVLPTAVIGGYSVLVHPMYSARYLTFAGPAVALLIARGLLALSRRWLRIGVAVLVLASAVPVYVSQRQLYAKNSSDWVTAASVIGAHHVAGQGIYFTPRYPTAAAPIGQTTRGVQTAYPGSFTGLIDLTLETTAENAGNLTGFSRPLTRSETTVDRLSAIWSIQRLDYPASSASSDRAYLLARGFKGDVVWQGPLDEVIYYYRQ